MSTKDTKKSVCFFLFLIELLQIMRLYQKIGLCRQKAEGDRLWNELTKSITQFRKSLSKLESYAYGMLRVGTTVTRHFRGAAEQI